MKFYKKSNILSTLWVLILVLLLVNLKSTTTHDDSDEFPEEMENYLEQDYDKWSPQQDYPYYQTFHPQESFIVSLNPKDNITLLFYSGQDKDLFLCEYLTAQGSYSESDENYQKGHIIVIVNGQKKRELKVKDFQTFKVQIQQNQKPATIRLIIESEQKQLALQLLLALKSRQTHEAQNAEKNLNFSSTQQGNHLLMQSINSKFQQVLDVILKQQFMSQKIMFSNMDQARFLNEQIYHTMFRNVIQTVIVISTGCICLFLLRKKMKYTEYISLI